MSKMIKSTSWNQVGLSKFLHQRTQEVNQLENRQFLFEKYRNGEGLTKEELKHFVNTSSFLNSTIDKDLYQTTLNCLDRNIVAGVELNIAEQLLETHQKNNQQLMDERKDWLIKENNLMLGRIAKRESKIQRRKELTANLNSTAKKKIYKFLEKYKMRLQDICLDEQNPARILNNPFVRAMIYFAKEAKKRVKQRKLENKVLTKQELFLLRQQKHSQQRPIIFDNYDAEEIRHFFHPHSKILMNINYGAKKKLIHKTQKHKEKQKQYEFQLKELQKQEQEIEKYRLWYYSHPKLKNERAFKEYISGGPQKPRESLFLFVFILKLTFIFFLKKSEIKNYSDTAKIAHSWITQHIEYQAASKIQKAVRGFLGRLRYRKLVQESEQHNYKIVQQKLENICFGKKFWSNMKKLDIFKTKQKEKVKQQKIQKKRPNRLMTKKLSLKKIDYLLSQKEEEKKKRERQHHEYTQEALQELVNTKGLFMKHRALFHAIQQKNLSLIQSSGYQYSPQDVNILNKENITALYLAAKNNNYQFCDWILLHGGKPNQICAEGNTPLHMAFSSQNELIIVRMLMSGGDLDIINEHRQTPLAFGKPDILHRLGLFDGVTNYYTDEDNRRNNQLIKTSPTNVKLMDGLVLFNP